MDTYKVYPKEFRNERIPIEKNRCFFIMPFSEEFDIVYGEIKNSLTKDNYICTRVDEISGSTPIINKILVEILKSQFIIADLTGCNPNVFYELGVAHVFKDAQNIFLLKQKNSIVPFDITHLTYIEYEVDNLKYITAQLKKSLRSNRYISDFYEALNIHGIINFVHDNQDVFVQRLKELLGKDISDVTDILNYSSSLSENDIEQIISRTQYSIQSSIGKDDDAITTGILDFYFELLLSCSRYNFIETFLYNIFNGFFDICNVNEKVILSYQINCALKFATKCKKLNIVMPWIVDYFKQSKFASVDINRYKLESFLLTTQYKEINDIICEAMTDKDCHIREHFADIIGEKKLYQAKDILSKQLLCEENYYSAASIIEALGKLRASECIKDIEEWINENSQNIINTKHYFVLRHTRNALAKIDKNLVKTFDAKYSEYLTEFIYN